MSCLTVEVTHGSQQAIVRGHVYTPTILGHMSRHRSTVTSRLAVHDRQCRDVRHTFSLQWITGRLALRHIDNPMHIEADLFRARRPSFVAEAIYVLAVVSSIEGVVTGGYCFLIDNVLICWADDLDGTERRVSNCCLETSSAIAARLPVAVSR